MIQRYLKILSYGIKLSKLYLVLRIFQLILSSASSAFSLLLPKMLLNAIATKNLKTVLIILSLSFFVSTINSLIDRFLSPKLSWLREKINAKIVDNFLQKSINLDLEYFDQPDAYDKYTIAFERCCAIVQGAFDILLSFISSLLQIGLVVYVLSWISPVVLLVFLTVCALQTYINNLIQLDNYKYQKFMNQRNRKLNYLYRLFYIPEFMRDIRANDIMRFIFTKKQKVTEKVLSDTYSTNQKVSTKNLIIAILSAIESFATMLYFSLEVVWQRIWYDDFVVSLSAYNRLKSAFSQIISNFVSLSTNDLYIKDYLSFMETASNVVCGRRQLISIDLVEFRNVSFRYPNVDGNALDNVSFMIYKGEQVAIVGKNGAGKTTIIKLLLRLYDPSDGMILINGVDIREYDLSSLRKTVSVLFQDYPVYAFSIRENLTLGEEISDEKIMAALERVGLLGKIMSFPQGLDTPITNQLYEGGIEFSGGETQRLALARAYLKEQIFLVFDEPTSSLDPFVENRFYEDLLSQTTNTMIVISHRITFTYRMSKIICLNKGHVVESGTPNELLNNPSSLYKGMYDLNTSKYIKL